jgi:RNA polymerase sigma-70 factor (ECF subfamily)
VLVAAREGLASEEALDAVQEAFETFLSLPQARALVEYDDEVEPFLKTIVRNAARNARRRHHRQRPHRPLEDEPLVDSAPSVEELISQAEQHVALLGCVRRLGEVQRQVVTLRLLEELSTAETAAALGLTKSHIATLLYRSKALLVACLAG